jgi:hypothetical protein
MAESRHNVHRPFINFASLRQPAILGFLILLFPLINGVCKEWVASTGQFRDGAARGWTVHPPNQNNQNKRLTPIRRLRGCVKAGRVEFSRTAIREMQAAK